MTIFKAIAVAGAMTLASTVGASAALLDFTDNSIGNAGVLGVGPGAVNYVLTSQGGALKRDTSISASEKATVPASVGPAGDMSSLALDNDGVGVKGVGGNDEVTEGGESLLLSFSRAIRLTGVHFLDLFVGNKAEFAITRNGGSNQLIVTTTATDGINSGAAGYAFSDVPSVAVGSISFVPGGANDNNDGDFALAAINYSARDGQTPDAVPLPAAGFLLLGALGGLAAARRGKKA